MVLKELIFNNFYFGGRCGGLERTYFLTVSTLGEGVWSSKNCLVTVSTYGEGVVVLKELIQRTVL